MAANIFSWRGATSFQHACTGSVKGDQFYLNSFFKFRWAPLGQKWNQQRKYAGRPVEVAADENTHFVGAKKPAWHLCEHDTFVK